MSLPLKLKVPGRLFYVRLRKVLGIECGATLIGFHFWSHLARAASHSWNRRNQFNCTTHINVCMYVRPQFMLFCCRMCCFLCRKCCLLQCCCVIFMQIVLILCKLCWYYANCVVFMQIVRFLCKLWHLSQFTLFCRKWHFCREIRALAGTFGPAIRRLLLLMMSEYQLLL